MVGNADVRFTARRREQPEDLPQCSGSSANLGLYGALQFESTRKVDANVGVVDANVGVVDANDGPAVKPPDGRHCRERA